jgi:hypothetical protein
MKTTGMVNNTAGLRDGLVHGVWQASGSFV